VTTILAELGMTPPTLCAALLHDTVEDTPYTLEECRKEFGDEVALLVDGVTKLDKVKYGDSAQAETIRKMVVAMSRDIRRAGDQARRPAAQHANAALPEGREAGAGRAETLEIYAPLAHRLGMNTIKWELETSRSPPCIPRSTTRSSAWWPIARRLATTSSPAWSTGCRTISRAPGSSAR
jgi:GTP pyrophosphokinase